MWRPGTEHRHTVWWQPLIWNKTKNTYFSIRWWCCGAGIIGIVVVDRERKHLKLQEHIKKKGETIPPPAPPFIPPSLCLQTWYPSRPWCVWLTLFVPAKNISTHILLFWSPTRSALIYCTLPCQGNNQGFPSLSSDELFLLTTEANAQNASL